MRPFKDLNPINSFVNERVNYGSTQSDTVTVPSWDIGTKARRSILMGASTNRHGHTPTPLINSENIEIPYLDG